ncbi:hypothetical protein LINPERPRIM_LOCUS30109 [Linum perenne]
MTMPKQKKMDRRKTSKKDKSSTMKGKTRTDSNKQVHLIDKELVEVLIDSFNPVTKTFNVARQLLTLEAGDVGRVYGLPTECRVVNPHLCGAKDLSKLEREINISFVGRAMFLNTQDIYTTWRDTTDPVAYAKMYILIALGELLATGNSFMVNMGYAQWAQHVVDTVISGIVKLKTEHPTCSFWHDGSITTALLEIRNDDQTFRMRIRSRAELQTSLNKKQFFGATSKSVLEEVIGGLGSSTGVPPSLFHPKDDFVIMTDSTPNRGQEYVLAEVEGGEPHTVTLELKFQEMLLNAIDVNKVPYRFGHALDKCEPWHVPDCPQQPDGTNCGIFILYFMEYFDRNFMDEQRSRFLVIGEVDTMRRIYAHMLAMVEDNSIWETEDGKAIMTAYEHSLSKSRKRKNKK